MLRTALRPRWIAVLLLALALATGMARLGEWQWQRARENSRHQTVQARAAQPAVPLSTLLRPRQSFTNAAADRPVTVEGSWDQAHQLLVANRYLSGRRGWWVLTPLRLPDGSAVAVVRGWTPAVSDAAASPSGPAPAAAGQVSLAGVLRPSEPPFDREPGAGTGLPDGQLNGVDLTELVQRWPYKLITGYVLLTGQTPVQTGQTPEQNSLQLVPPTSPGTASVAWQNMSYAVQWFGFAGFGIFMWWRLVRDDHLGRLRPNSPVINGTLTDSSVTDSTVTDSTVIESVPDRGAML